MRRQKLKRGKRSLPLLLLALLLLLTSGCAREVFDATNLCPAPALLPWSQEQNKIFLAERELIAEKVCIKGGYDTCVMHTRMIGDYIRMREAIKACPKYQKVEGSDGQ